VFQAGDVACSVSEAQGRGRAGPPGWLEKHPTASGRSPSR
jgi:hypothetical protein